MCKGSSGAGGALAHVRAQFDFAGFRVLDVFMTAKMQPDMHSPSVLDHGLESYFPALLKFGSTKAMEASPVYREIRPRVERVLNAVVCEDFANVQDGTAELCFGSRMEY